MTPLDGLFIVIRIRIFGQIGSSRTCLCVFSKVFAVCSTILGSVVYATLFIPIDRLYFLRSLAYADFLASYFCGDCLVANFCDSTRLCSPYLRKKVRIPHKDTKAKEEKDLNLSRKFLFVLFEKPNRI